MLIKQNNISFSEINLKIFNTQVTIDNLLISYSLIYF